MWGWVFAGTFTTRRRLIEPRPTPGRPSYTSARKKRPSRAFSSPRTAEARIGGLGRGRSGMGYMQEIPPSR